MVRRLFGAAAIAGLVTACGGPDPGAAAPPAAETASEAPVGRDLIGRWRDERAMVAGRIEIVREDGNLVLEQTFDLDGSTLRYDLVETSSDLGRRFDPAGDATTSDVHWVITPAGTLQIRDRLGLVATARPD